MEHLYHFTKFDNLFPNEKYSNLGILKPEGLSLWASPHKLFKNQEYIWIKGLADSAIKKILSHRNVNYQQDDVTNVQPGIISFCKNGTSGYMWERYAKHGDKKSLGVILELKFDEIKKNVFKERYDSLMNCKYLKKYNSIGKLSAVISKMHMSLPYETDSLQLDLYMSIAFLKQKHFKREKEFRYVRSGSLFTVDSNTGTFDDNPRSTGSILDASIDEFVLFSHNSLEKIIVDSQVPDHEISRLSNLLYANGYKSVEIIRKS